MAVVPPPSEPTDAFDGPWDEIEADARTPLPQDYKDFVRLYGSGVFMEFLTVNIPRVESPYIRFEAEIRTVRKIFYDDDDFIYALWPDSGGLIAFGATDFGDFLFWQPIGPPEDWRVVVWGRGFQQFEFFDCDLTGFLAGLATGEIEPDDFGDMLPCHEMFKRHSDFPEREDPGF
ncbi:SMI1/KNR4 family protein [Phenylobacterium sp.]|uniref:SMI1/KNR4 family protein n=1 Tax=Phenylobacterium sp. TaxID=1871053 RepID=UPI00273640DA|nr:SMI1/KNR4 family protein [Phenylobacterium sp.]MDP3660846.1 SMI1/KNR4 family protein [Phenylobacterium sp.]